MSEISDLGGLAAETARDAETFTTAVREIAAGGAPETAIPLLLLLLSQLQMSGARLGAVQDVVPAERFESDPGAEADLDPLRQNLANLFEGIDDYTDLVDPVTSVEPARGAVSDDLTDIVQALEHGLVHYRAGRTVEALWWWQFSYLSEWGVRAASCLRVLLTILRHLRLDVDDDAAAEAEFDALHP
ncbi:MULTISPECIES: DUF5063 domain-containing protein [Yimella]|uniref:Uncharacterized protein DUF5063 n=1 Tax=Yimella lutea TaxID=587872 RepID=A0A542ED94_9MICO|nr:MULTISPECIES: DUF5063 domain-containing protein [Yimella]MCG8656462.1 DUF5063 domain-containing protein [Yimella sp. NH-Cas1]RYG78452.1 DUF5063 domain-containing protein [Yimella sp. RIT 621]TQJ13302.1 uncharacterized protein DUF5063 [Yimella lutea]